MNCKPSACPLLNSALRSFTLVRSEDVSGSSGLGIVATGIELHDGQIVLKWERPPYATALYRDLHAMMMVHEHGGKTKVVFHQCPFSLALKKSASKKKRKS